MHTTQKVYILMRHALQVTAAFIAHTAAVMAHPGHGSPQHASGATHYVANPEHALPWIAAVVVAIAAFRYVRSARNNASAQQRQQTSSSDQNR
jgi:hypothetical protein